MACTCAIILNGMQPRLREDRGVSAGIGMLSRFFRRQDYTKKNRSRLQAGPIERLGRAGSLDINARPSLTPSGCFLSPKSAQSPRSPARAAEPRKANGYALEHPMAI